MQGVPFNRFSSSDRMYKVWLYFVTAIVGKRLEEDRGVKDKRLGSLWKRQPILQPTMSQLPQGECRTG